MRLYKRYRVWPGRGRVHYRGPASPLRMSGPAPSTDRRSETIKRTFQPKKRYRRRVHGFLRRMSARGGVRVVRNRRRKGRLRLSA
jgi:large subunit ribosomal protein L34